ncbi:hypothetical protein JCM8202_004354 [Rhodotorula sphaerocarpa]
MSALAPVLRQATSTTLRRSAPRVAQPVARRFASSTPEHATYPHHWEPPHYSLKEKISKFTPTEVYPLLAAVATVSAFAVANIYWAFQRPEGELRLVPGRMNKKQPIQPWEDPRALEGKW